MIYEFTPYARDKRYGRVLNSHIAPLPEDAWICVRDRDTMYLHPHSGDLMERAIADHPDAVLFTCRTNRISGGPLSDEADIVFHCEKAEWMHNFTPSYSPTKAVVPAFFWLFPKRVWRTNPFDDEVIVTDQGSFDVRWCRSLPPGKRLRIDNLYLFHLYRLYKNHYSVSHLV